MEINKIKQEYADGNITKRVYWSLFREKMLSMLEIQGFIENSDTCQNIEIGKDGIVLSLLSGEKMLFDFTQPICRPEVMLTQTEEEDWSFLKKLIHEKDVIFDIGANQGIFSIQALNYCSDLDIYAFEPLQNTYKKMQRNLKLNSMEDKLKIFNMGISNETGYVTFYLPPACEAASMTPNNDDFYMSEGNVGQKIIEKRMDEVVCQVMTLDDFVAEHNIDRSDFIKCDVEGAEKLVVDGGARVFCELKPMLYIEMLRKHAKRFGYHPNDIIKQMKEWGYSCYRIENHKLYQFNFMDESTVETNFLFLNEAKHKYVLDLYEIK